MPTCILPNGVQIDYPEWDEGVGKHLRETGQHEMPLVQKFLEHVKDGDTVVIAGSNLGVYDCSVFRHKKNITLYSFEPIPDMMEYLVDNILESNKSNGSVSYRFINALAARSGFVDLWHDPEGHHTGCSTKFTYDPNFTKLCRVDTRTLNELFANGSPIHALKMDVEGMEQDIIGGAHTVFDNPWARPRVVMAEWQRKIGAPCDYVDYLISKGYKAEVWDCSDGEETRPGFIRSSREVHEYEYLELGFVQ